MKCTHFIHTYLILITNGNQILQGKVPVNLYWELLLGVSVTLKSSRTKSCETFLEAKGRMEMERIRLTVSTAGALSLGN